MIFIGNDIIEINRIKYMIKKYQNTFLDKIFTKHEKEYCNSKYKPEIHYAGRFAAKEAVKKILLQENQNVIVTLKNIEIVRNTNYPPVINIINGPQKKIKLSISHTNNYATAIALLNLY